MKYQIKISRAKIVGLVIVSIFVAVLAYNSYTHNPAFDSTSSDIAPVEYWNVFKDSVKNRFRVLNSVTARFQNPISDLESRDNKYFLEVYKWNIPTDISLDKFISESTNSKIIINDVTYMQRGGALFDVSYKMENVKVSHIDLNIIGEEGTTVKNDSVASFYSKFKTFSIRYSNSDTTAIWAMSDGKAFTVPTTNIPATGLPIDIMFIKKRKAVYLLLMSVNDSRAKLSPYQLSQMLRRKG
ncbi:MAG: hypothetical protein JST32_17775 [Bacteroidetes bacterium]|nr:hypothetical protein [Bacteroidota bacterium]